MRKHHIVLFRYITKSFNLKCGTKVANYYHTVLPYRYQEFAHTTTAAHVRIPLLGYYVVKELDVCKTINGYLVIGTIELNRMPWLECGMVKMDFCFTYLSYFNAADFI